MSAARSSVGETCFGCRHFRMTYRADWPFECAAFELRSKRHPVHAVRESSGLACQAREARPGTRAADKPRRDAPPGRRANGGLDERA